MMAVLSSRRFEIRSFLLILGRSVRIRFMTFGVWVISLEGVWEFIFMALTPRPRKSTSSLSGRRLLLIIFMAVSSCTPWAFMLCSLLPIFYQKLQKTLTIHLFYHWPHPNPLQVPFLWKTTSRSRMILSEWWRGLLIFG